ncbi:MAG: PAS domain S-box protein [Bacteroidota bacterium]
MNKETPVPETRSTRNDLYQRMIEEIQDYALILMNREGIIQNWNKGAQKIKMYLDQEIIGKHFSVFYLPEDIENGLPGKLIEEAASKGRSAQEGWRKRKDGSRFWASVTITALHDDENNIIGFGKVTRDLSEKKIAEDNLRISEERYHKMIAEVQDYAIILLSPEGIIENWNMGAEKIKGYSAQEVIGKNFELFYTPEARANNLPAKLLKEAKENRRATHEGWRVRKNGTQFWGSITITALHGKNGEIIGFSKVTRDLTQQKITEEKILAYNVELQIQNGELEQFAYVASHDLQEPLRKIQIFSELIQENYTNEEYVKMYFEKLISSAQRMGDLVKSLLNYSRLSKDKEEYLDTTDLNTIVEDIRQDFELLIEEKKAKIICDKLPTILGNRLQIGQLFSNLISNSLKFSKTDPVITISSGLINKDFIQAPQMSLINTNYYYITFEDNGIGFEQQYDKIIFSLFQRLHGKQEYAGTGIGLALCKKIIEKHQGLITATSELGQGAKFNVYLPVPEN